MRVKLKADNSLEFLDGVAELNENDDLVVGVEVVTEVPTNSKEKLAIGFQYGEIDENSNLYSAKMSMYKQSYDTWHEMIPNQILKTGGLWTFQIFREVYNRSTDPIAVKASTPATFTINPGIKIGDKKVTEAMVSTVWDGALSAKDKAFEYKEYARDEALKAAKSASSAASSATSAGSSARDANSSYQLAHASALNAGASESNAKDSATSAETAKTACEVIQTDCKEIQESVKNDIEVIEGYKNDAEAAQKSAVSAATTALKAELDASAHANTAVRAKDIAVSAKDETVLKAEKVNEQYEKVKQLAGNIDNALTFSTYKKAVEYFNETNTDYAIGKSIYIATKDVPDLWIADIATEPTQYIYTSDAEFLRDLRSSPDNMLKIGKYFLAEAEGAKVFVSANIEDGEGKGAVQQVADGGEGGFDFTGKNANATTLDPTLTGIIPYGAVGDFSSSFGGKSSAQGKRSHAEGTTTVAKGDYSHAEGNSTVALGTNAHAEGLQTTAVSNGAHSEGELTVANGKYSHTEGKKVTSSGDYSHAEGEEVLANGFGSHAEGYRSKTEEAYSHAEGEQTTSFGKSSHAEGEKSFAYGKASHAEGYNTAAQGDYSHAEGHMTIVTGLSSHTEGYETQARSKYSHAEGYETIVTEVAEGAHAEGRNTEASGRYAHAEGRGTKAVGEYSHAEGYETQAIGAGSHTSGKGTVANQAYQAVIGQYNDNKSDTIFEVGNGKVGAPSNAFEVYKDGGVKAGRETTDADDDLMLATKGYAKKYGGAGSGNNNSNIENGKGDSTIQQKNSSCETTGDFAVSFGVGGKYVGSSTERNETSRVLKAISDAGEAVYCEYGTTKYQVVIKENADSCVNQYDAYFGTVSGNYGCYVLTSVSPRKFSSFSMSNTYGYTGVNKGNASLITGTKQYNGAKYSFVTGTQNIVGDNKDNTYNNAVYGSFNIVKGAKNSLVGGKFNTVIDGQHDVVLGNNNTVNDAIDSIVGGRDNNATSFYNSIAVGTHLTVSGESQAVFGTHNSNKENTLLEVGNGEDGKPGNAFEVYKDGTAKLSGSAKADDDVTTVADVKKIVKESVGDFKSETFTFIVKDANGVTSTVTKEILLK